MAFTLKQHYATTGSGLGYQISAYIMMRSLEIKTGQTWVVDQSAFKALRNTFKDLRLNFTNDLEDYRSDSVSEILDFDDAVGFNALMNAIDQHSSESSIEFDLYPTIANIYADEDTFQQVKSELIFRDDIYDICKAYRDSIDGEVISMHVRRGDFKDITNGMFLCGTDYFENALAELPPDLPVLIFTNDKDDVIADSELIASDPSRFTFITDLFNNNQFINCDVGQELDQLIDISGESKFDYKMGLAQMVKNKLGAVPDYDTLTEGIKDLVIGLAPEYKNKLKAHMYNYSLDMCLMSMCDYHIVSNSTYGFWSSELCNSNMVVYPKYWMQGHTDDIQVKSDLGDFDQTASLAPMMCSRDNYVGVVNPDPRSFTFVS